MANKEHSFTVNLTFSKKVNKKELQEIANNIADALQHNCEHGVGLSPENSEAFTEKIVVVTKTGSKVIVDMSKSYSTKTIKK